MKEIRGFLGKVSNKIKEDPTKAISMGLAGSSLVVSTTNMVGNKKRREEANKHQLEQLDAMNKLTKTLDRVNSSLQSNSTSETSKNNNKNNMTTFKKKTFSIEQGGYKGGKRTPGQHSVTAGVVAGGIGGGILGAATGQAGGFAVLSIIGAGLGAFTQWMANVADKSDFNTPQSRETSQQLISLVERWFYDAGGSTETMVSDTVDAGDSYSNVHGNHYDSHSRYGGYLSTNVHANSGYINSSRTVQKSVVNNRKARKLLPYEVDKSPNEYIVSVILRFGVLVMYINNPHAQELRVINQALDGYCYKYKNADYKASTVAKNCYVVELQVVGGANTVVSSVLAPLMRSAITINFISGNKISVPQQNKVHFKPKPQVKEYSLKSDLIHGASTGAAIGGLGSMFLRNQSVLGVPAENNFQKALIMVGAGTIIGAALGALVSGVKSIAQTLNRKNTVDARLLQGVVEDLQKTGFKDGIHFTRDPKKANELSARVSIVVSKSSGEMNLLINTVTDDKLKDITSDIIGRLPNTSAVSKKVSDKYNDITITTISDNSANIGLIAGICEYFIRHGYPVYLVEVG